MEPWEGGEGGGVAEARGGRRDRGKEMEPKGRFMCMQNKRKVNAEF